MKRNSSKTRRRSGDAGFTLVELVVVIAVLAILAGVGMVAYNGYIEYAQKGKDRALVGEIGHAINVVVQTDENIRGIQEEAEGSAPVLIGTVTVYSEENGNDVVAVSSLTTDSGEVYDFITPALIDAFGENYKSALRLAYSGWMYQDTTVAAAKGFVGKTAEILVDEVGDCADKLAELLDDSTAGKLGQLLNFGGSGIGDKVAQQAGYADLASVPAGAERNRIMGNITVFCMAEYVKNNPDAIKSGSYGFSVGDYTATNGKGAAFGPTDGSNLVYSFATSYAAIDALTSYLESKGNSSLTADFNNILNISKSGNSMMDMVKVLQAMGNTKSSMMSKIKSDPALKALVDEYYNTEVEPGKTQAALDGEAFVDIMEKVSEQSATYNTQERLKTDTLFDSTSEDSVTKALTSIVSGDTEGGLTIKINSDGSWEVGDSNF